ESADCAPLQVLRRRAKYLLLDFPSGSVIVHLGMKGSMMVVDDDQPPGVHDHVDLVFGDRALRLRDPRRFGLVLWQPGDALANPLLARIGIDPLWDAFT
ncbi:DNA-formamidopyrimidine glycosylase, partial [Aromatoleum toluclasticum]|uniref:DNA-formamidopyrimidine glycosylase family protein n=1 Tax=Aromatoleum toluclasticum TaxID=92003 RepID=UPI002B1CC3F3